MKDLDESKNVINTCKLYWYTGILKGIEIVKNRPSDYQLVAKSVQEKVEELEKELEKSGHND